MSIYTHVLVAVDLAPDSAELIRKAKDIASLNKARLSLAHVVEYLPVEPTGEALMPVSGDLETELLDGAQRQLAELAAANGAGDCAHHVVLGNTARDLARLVEEHGIDLLIAGAHERHGLSLFAGGTERSLLKHAPCDVLVVRLKNS
ncbi:MAG: universal stress protein [Gammaproteobacteria bacterium]